MKRGIITALIATCAMALLFFWGCENDEFYLDSESSTDSDKNSDATPECVRYVDPDIVEPGDALSWEKAVPSVEEAADLLPMDTESFECEIWVKGNLVPENNLTKLPIDLDNVKIVDGFQGNETARPKLSRISSGVNDTASRFRIDSPSRVAQRGNTTFPDLVNADHSRIAIPQDNYGVPKSDETSDYYRIYGLQPYLEFDDTHSDYDWRIRSLPGGNLHVFRNPYSDDAHNIALGPNKGTVSIGTEFRNNTNVFDADLTIYSTNAPKVPPEPIPDEQHAIMHLTADGDSERNSAKIIFSDYDRPENQHFEIDFNVGDEDLHFRSDQRHLMTMTNRGRVGIRNSTPTSTLDVRYGRENNGTRGTLSITDGGDKMIFDGNEIDAVGNGDLFINYNTNNDVHMCAGSRRDPVNIGQVTIGTKKPYINALLTVDGLIAAEEIIVRDVGADFVFDDDYNLMSLAEVEEFIDTNNHLPDIPSAKEAQENGTSLGERQTLLLQKIEELTLHLIEQNKRIEALEAKNSRCEN